MKFLVLLSKSRIAFVVAFCIAALVSPSLLVAARANPQPRVAIIYDNGGRGDHAVNDAAAQGIDMAKKSFNLSSLDIRELVTDGSEVDRENRLRFLAKAGYNLIITTGPAFADALNLVASEYPNIQFAILDSEAVPLINVTAALFNENQGAFLAGLVAALESHTKRVGLIAGTGDNPAISMAFTKGVIFSGTATKVFVRSPKIAPSADVSYLLSQKVDVIYSRWSNSSEVVSSAAKINLNRKTPRIRLIGQLPDQYFLSTAAPQSLMIGTVVNRVDFAVKLLVKSTMEGRTFADIVNPETGVYGHSFSVSDGAIEISLSVPNKVILAKINLARKAIYSGKIKLPS